MWAPWGDGGIPLASAWCIMKLGGGGGIPFIGAEKAEGKWSLGTPLREVSIVGTGFGTSSKRGDLRPLETWP